MSFGVIGLLGSLGCGTVRVRARVATGWVRVVERGEVRGQLKVKRTVLLSLLVTCHLLPGDPRPLPPPQHACFALRTLCLLLLTAICPSGNNVPV